MRTNFDIYASANLGGNWFIFGVKYFNLKKKVAILSDGIRDRKYNTKDIKLLFGTKYEIKYGGELVEHDIILVRTEEFVVKKFEVVWHKNDFYLKNKKELLPLSFLDDFNDNTELIGNKYSKRNKK